MRVAFNTTDYSMISCFLLSRMTPLESRQCIIGIKEAYVGTIVYRIAIKAMQMLSFLFNQHEAIASL